MRSMRIPPLLVDELDGSVQDGEISQPKEVHLEQAQLGHRVHGILGHHHRAVFVAAGGTLERHRFGERFISDEDTGGVGTDVVNDSLKRLGVIDEVPDRPVVLIVVHELGIGAHRVGQRSGLQRDHAGDAVDISVAHAHATTYVTESSFGAHGTEGDDLGNPVAAVAVDDVTQDLVATIILEVHVDVGHFLTLEIPGIARRPSCTP